MNDKNIFDALRDIDVQWILDAAPQKRVSQARVWIKWGAMAACLCLVVAAVVGAVFWLMPNEEPIPPEVTLPHVHAFGEWQTTKDATCSTQGEETRLCTCGEKEIRYTALLQHFAGEWVVEKEPTIKLPTPEDPNQREPGIKAQFCEHCGAKLDEELIPATGSLGLAYAINPDGKTFSVAGIGNCTDEEIIIPENFCGYHVTGIIKDAFYFCRTMKSVTIPQTVATIGEGAFRSCLELESITLPQTLTSIGAKAFQSCSALTAIEIPATVTSIGAGAFDGCSFLKQVVVPNGVTRIENSTFSNCIRLESVTLPQGLEYIGNSAFYYCTKLNSIEIPSGVTSIGEYAFYRCYNLTSIVLPQGIKVIEAGSFYACSKLTNINIPHGVTRIEGNSFGECNSLVSISVPSSVTTIEMWAFAKCNQLETVILEEGVERIERGAFENCKNLCNFLIPESVQYIDDSVFSNCNSLIQVDNGVSYVDKWAVGFDNEHKEVVLRADTVGIAGHVFYIAYNVDQITLPNSLKYIGSLSFSAADSLKTVIFDGTQEEWEAIKKESNWKYPSDVFDIVFLADAEE